MERSKKRKIAPNLKPGIASTHNAAHFAVFPDELSRIQNGHILKLYSDVAGFSVTNTFKALQLKFPEDVPGDSQKCMITQIQRQVNKVKRFKKLSDLIEFKNFVDKRNENFLGPDV